MSLSIDGRTCTSVHFVGILGSGMSAIAQYLRWDGITVSGSDRMLDAPHAALLRGALEHIGCRLCPQDGSGVGNGTHAVVVSTAIEKDNPDITAARRRNVPVLHRSDVLAAIVRTRKTVAVAGTNGKSTVTALIFHLLDAAGKGPSLITGANVHSLIERGLIGNAFYGTSDILVIEADESDGSCIKYQPALSVFLNVSRDHKPVEETVGLFRILASRSDTVIVNADDPLLGDINTGFSFGTSPTASYRADLSSDENAAYVHGKRHRFSIPFPGRHMAADLCAALCVCSHAGVAENDLAAAAQSFRGLQRRFDRIPTRSGVLVIDDYAHNPDKIRAAITTAQSISPRLFALFQPHGFGPTRFMFEDLVAAFGSVLRPTDTLFLLPIYYAGGTARKDISSDDIAQRLASGAATILAPCDRTETVQVIARAVRSGDVVLSMGARDASLPAFAQSIADAIDRLAGAAPDAKRR